jgi:Kef-type K+ transport system membrane component KefB
MLEAANPSTRGLWLGYTAILAFGILTIVAVSWAGAGLSVPTLAVDGAAVSVATAKGAQVDVVFHVIATLAAVVALGFLIGQAFRFIGQPPVIGEVVAGIVMGPSILGALWPEALHTLIPSADVDPKGQVPAAIKAVSQLGVILYMFVVGLELNVTQLKARAHSAVAVSHSSIVVPFAMGTLLALFAYSEFSHAGVPFTSFALFMGVSMAITAFPVLARILADREIEKTRMGIIAISCAAVDDVTAWCLLAFVVGVAQSDFGATVRVISGTAVFIAVMFWILRPLMQKWVMQWQNPSMKLPPIAISGVFLAVLLTALTTEYIGIHAIFGPFLLGAIIPSDSRIAHEFTNKLKDPVNVLLLPAFFAFTGLRTQIGLIDSWENVLWCIVFIVVATIGKFGGAVIGGLLSGTSLRDSAILGALMNTRGLMELLVLNIGLDLGVISPKLFTMLVIMAIVTTAMTSPMLSYLMPKQSTASSLA